LGIEGTLEVYCRGVRGVTRNGIPLQANSGFKYDLAAHKLTVPFSGATDLTLAGAVSLFAAEGAAKQRHR